MIKAKAVINNRPSNEKQTTREEMKRAMCIMITPYVYGENSWLKPAIFVAFSHFLSSSLNLLA